MRETIPAMKRPRSWQQPDAVEPPWAPAPTTPPARPTRVGTYARGLTGSLAVGLLALALVLIGVQFWATHQGQEGPGLISVLTHTVSAVVALTLQAIADRRRDQVGGWCALGVLLVTVGNVWFWWWL